MFESDLTERETDAGCKDAPITMCTEYGDNVFLSFLFFFAQSLEIAAFLIMKRLAKIQSSNYFIIQKIR